jgi:lipopolysaccharide export system protein LptA
VKRHPLLHGIVTVAGAIALQALALPACAEKADKDKPINFTADQVDANYEQKNGSLKGNVVLTQGTLTIRGDRMDFKQNADNSVSATVYGNPLSFRQKKDDADEYFEGFAQRAVYDGTKEFLQLFDRALLRDGQNEIRSNYITYNSTTSKFTAEGGPEKAGATQAPEGRVRGMFMPNEKDQAGGQKGGPGAKAAPGKANAKGDNAPAKTDAKAEKAPAPLKLTPETTIRQ